jgi:MraZ protein
VFVGTYEHSVDGKGRLVLPSKFRLKLPEGGFLAPSANGLALWPPAAFEEMVDRFTEQVRSGEADPDVVIGVTANAEEVAPDAQGRILLSPRLRELTGVGAGEVVLLGARDHVEIWTAATWQSRRGGITRSATEAFAAGRGV